MELIIPTIYESIGSNKDFPMDVCGPSSFNLQQLIINAYSPKISVISTKSADLIAQKFGDVENIRHLFNYFENIFAFGSYYNKPVSSNNGTSTMHLSGSGCVKFVDDITTNLNLNNNKIDELFELNNFNECLKNYVSAINDKLSFLNNSNFSFETYHNEYLKISNLQNSIYMKLISMLLSSTQISSFECFNHPVLQLMVISGNDTNTDINDLTTKLKQRKIPQWFDESSVLQLALILVDQNDSEMLQNALKIQEEMKIKYGKKSTILSIDLSFQKEDILENDSVILYPSVINNIENSCNTLKEKKKNTIVLNKKSFNSWKRLLEEIISKDLVLFMNTKIKQWNDEVVNPRTSLTGKIFGSRKWGNSNKPSFFSFGNNRNTLKADEDHNISYNSNNGYYMAKSPEMILRKLGDWYFMLGDYKNAYTTYELVKKDMNNDKAYLHLASLQESIVFSLFMGVTSKPGLATHPITPKMIANIINPMIDSSFYTYLSKCNLRTYTLRLIIISAELYFLLGQYTAGNASISGLPPNYPSAEIYFMESVNLFRKSIDSKLLDNLSNGYLMQRISYIFFSYDKPINDIQINDNNKSSYYEAKNENKLQISTHSIKNFGIPKTRKMVFWLLLSIKEIDPVKEPIQAQIALWRMEDQLQEDLSYNNILDWLNQQGGLLHKVKAQLPQFV